MSCTENESSPFVVFFLPAVVGCLTILLARRWANSQVANTSSSAFSRRRKINKDPLIKRPLPPITCPKMVQPGAKKIGVSKKGSFPVMEEEANGGGKRIRANRVSPSNATAVAAPEKVADGPVAPKHIPFPYIPQDGDLLFEAMTFMFVVVASGLQFLNLYRTAWWLPNSQINEAMHFHLIDPDLVGFILIFLSRRLLLSVTLALLKLSMPYMAPVIQPHAYNMVRMITLGMVLGVMAWCTYLIYLKYSYVKVFYICYPALIYLATFGFKASPFLELHSSDPPLHCCSHDPNHIKTEVEVLRHDFNMRVKKILFNSVVGTYYSSFIPLCFAQSYLYYDVYASSQQVGFVWGGLFARYCSQLLSAAYCDVSHRAALHLADHRTNTDPPQPSSAACAPPGPAPAAPAPWEWWSWARAPPISPGQLEHARFFAVFINPSILLCILLCLQLSLIVVQLCLIFGVLAWHHFISTVILLFINYYTVFKMIRDYLVAWKVYKAEHMIQEKNYVINYSH